MPLNLLQYTHLPFVKQIFRRKKEGKVTNSILKGKLKKVTVGASAAVSVLEEYADAQDKKKVRNQGNIRLKTDRRYMENIQRKISRRNDVQDDPVYDEIMKLSEDVSAFLKQRDIFWDQVRTN